MDISLDVYVQKYIEVRDAKAAYKAAVTEELSKFDEALGKIERYVLSALDSQGVDSIRTSAGSAYRTTKASVSVQDKQAFMDYVKGTQSFDLLDIKANKTAVDAFLEEHQDLPPGVSRTATVSVNFRR